ncbi:MAG: hypothetical protein ACJA08_002787 [Cyclobacteriaceae bacterium]|jgi:hypothetical protein
MKVIKVYFLTIFFCSLFGTKVYAQGTEVGATFEITDVAVNMFLTEQYNKAGFQRSYTDNVGSFTFTVDLLLPEIAFLNNNAKIHFGFKVDASNNAYDGILRFEDDFAFIIPTPSVSDVSVVGISEAFVSKVNSLSTHQEIKDAIIAEWEDLELEVYPEKLAKRISTTWMENQSIKIVSPYFSIDVEVDPGKVKITTNTHLEGDELFEVRAVSSGGGEDIYTRGSKNFTVKRLEILSPTNPPQELVDIALNIDYEKGDLDGVFLKTTNYAAANYYIRILYETPNTFHVRTFKLGLGVGTTFWVSLPGTSIQNN